MHTTLANTKPATVAFLGANPTSGLMDSDV